MEAFNQAYDEFTGVHSLKVLKAMGPDKTKFQWKGACQRAVKEIRSVQNANSSKGCHAFSLKSSPKDRTQDRKLLFKISSLLEKKEIEVASYPEDLFEEQEQSDSSDIDVSGEQGYSLNDDDCDQIAKDVIFAKNGCDDKVKLTDEEKETFVSEGLPVPSRIPLTKAEERALKRIRRKIKNKLSAQESRRKKKEYVEGLEKRVETCNSENSILRQKVDSLESTVRALLTELNRLRKVSLEKERRERPEMRSKGTQTGTCLKCLKKRNAVYKQQNLARLEHLRKNNNFCTPQPYSLHKLETQS